MPLNRIRMGFGNGIKSPIGTRKLREDGYMRVRVSGPGKLWLLEHRVIWERAHGPLPRGAVLHHINADRTDNRLENLELCANQSEHIRKHRHLMIFNQTVPHTAERRAKKSAAMRAWVRTPEGLAACTKGGLIEAAKRRAAAEDRKRG